MKHTTIFLLFVLYATPGFTQQDVDTLGNIETIAINTEGSDLAPVIRDRQFYDSVIKLCISRTGLRNVLFYSGETENFPRIYYDKTTKNRVFEYNIDLFNSMFNSTGSEFAVESVIEHEIAHLLSSHFLRAAEENDPESNADYYSGYMSAKKSASFLEAIAVIHIYGDFEGDNEHGDKVQRINMIRKGWLRAQDATGRKNIRMIVDMIKQDSVMLLSVSPGHVIKDSIGAYNIYGVTITSNQLSHLFVDGILVGKELLDKKGGIEKLYIYGSIYFIDKERNIFTIDKNGIKKYIGKQL